MNDATIQRPSGKTYRPRKAPSVETYVDRHDHTGAVVLRTHDIELASRLAANEISELSLDPTKAYTDWWRLLPYDPNGYHDTAWVQDTVRGVPCVVIPYE